MGRDMCVLRILARRLVSIHAPRVGRDTTIPQMIELIRVSIHAPRVGRDKQLDLDT